MTNKIEQEFYKAFDIPVMGCYKNPNDYCTYDNEKYNKCKAQGLECPRGKLTYPPITDRILLELVCLYLSLPQTEVYLKKPSINEMKEDILIYLKDYCNEYIEISYEPYIESKVYDEVRKIIKGE